MERQLVDEFYEEYKKKYTRKLEGWQEVIDMCADQELQKIEEEQKYKERKYLQQKERERNCYTQPQREKVPVSFPKDQEETQVKAINTGNSTVASVSTPIGLDTRTQTVSSTNVVYSTGNRECCTLFRNVDWQRQQG